MENTSLSLSEKRRIAATKYPVGTVQIRTRHKRGGEQRAWIKIAEPNVWVLRAQHVWKACYGPIPPGMGVHHKDRDKLNDCPENLELMSKADHIAEHRHEWVAKQKVAVSRATKGRTWSTKTKDPNKRDGRRPTYDPEAMKAAVSDFYAGNGTINSIAANHGITWSALNHVIEQQLAE
jgi:hypothetical protein